MEIKYDDAFLNYSCYCLNFYINDLEKMIKEKAPYCEILKQYTKAEERLFTMYDLLSVSHYIDDDSELDKHDGIFDLQEKRLIRLKKYIEKENL